MATWCRCYLAALQKNALLRRHALVPTLLELLMPSLFMLLLSIGYWLSTDDTSPSKTYTGVAVNISSVIYDSGLFCTWYVNSAPPSIPKCTDWENDMVSFVVGLPNGWNWMYATNGTLAAILVGYLASIEEAFLIPDFDGYMIIQGFVDSIFSFGNPLEKSPKASLSHPGSLLVVTSPHDREDRMRDAFTAYCSNMSYYCSEILDATNQFTALDDARQYAYVNGDQVWAILDLSQIDFGRLVDAKASAGVDVDVLPMTISMNYTATPWTFQHVIPMQNGLGRKEYLLYMASGFLTLQQFATDFLFSLSNRSSPAGPPPSVGQTAFASTFGVDRVAAAPMPTRAYFTSQFLVQSGQFIPLVMTFAMLYGLSRLLSGIVEEKEGKVREAMLIMGMPLSAFYLSWITTSLVLNAIACIGSTAVLKATLFNSVDPVVMWIVNYVFSLTVMAMSMLLSVFFSKPRIASIIGPLIMFACSVPYYAIPIGTPQKFIFLASALPCTAYAQAIDTFVSYAQNGYGVTFASMFQGDYSIFVAVVFMLLDTAGYLLLALYLDLVLPSEHGTRYHPLFFLFGIRDAVHRWRTPSETSVDETSKLLSMNIMRDSGVVKHQDVLVDALHEAFAPATPVVVRALGLVKTYDASGNGKPIRAVRGISMNLHQGHIHVLLGHNGAGKSSTINMLVGLVPPTAGSVEVCGMPLTSSLSQVRQRLGYCPQHNIIWPTLTVEQHLRLYARLKATSWNVEEKLEETLDLIQLHDKRHAQASSLSGGQKRKLCVGIALIGDSPFLLLDEPTAGMDVEARRSMWDLLLKIRRHRCVLLSTHFMDEADLLADRIIIMSHGEIYSAGTPLFLKSRLGIGYSVHCVLEHESYSAMYIDAIRSSYLESVRSSAADTAGALLARSPEASHHHSSEETIQDITKRGKEVVVRLPMSFTAVAGRVFKALEDRQAELHISSFGLSLTTMEDVFLSIALLGDADAEKDEDAAAAHLATGSKVLKESHNSIAAHDAISTTDVSVGDQDTEKVSANEPCGLSAANMSSAPPGPFLLFCRHFYALLCKRAHCAKRDRKMLCFQVIMPIVFLSIALLILLIHAPDQPPLVLNSSLYGEPTEVFVTSGAAYPHPMNTSYADVLFPPYPHEYSMEAQMLLYDQGLYLPALATECDGDLATSADCLSTRLMREYNSHSTPRYVAYDPVTLNQYPFSLTGPTSTVFHNATAPHSLPEALALASNLVFRRLYERRATIQVTNYPLTLSQAQETLINSIRRIVSAIFILIPFTFVPANFVCYIVKEKECKAKHLQWVAGANMLAFWLSNLVWDLATFLCTEFLCIFVFLAFKRDEFIGDSETFAATFCLFFLYGLSSIPFSYVVSFAFRSSSTGQNITMMGNFFAGFLLVMAAQILSAIPSTQETNRWLCKFYRAVPAYALGEGIITLTGRELAMYVTGDTLPISPFAMLDYSNENGGFFGGVGTSLIYMGAAAPFFFFMLLVLEGAQAVMLRLSVRSVRHEPSAEELADYGVEDDDVLRERQEAEAVAHHGDVLRYGREGDGVVVTHLRKHYKAGNKVAVKHLSFGVKEGETFALLGTNGAGKTTTISTLTSEHVPTCGDAFIHGHSIVKATTEARKLIGYCPQFDALMDHMTPREHLVMYCRLRGLNPHDTHVQTEHTIKALCLEKYADTMSMSLSGGNKRKLSLGIALIGDTKCILLDEPTAGMDPLARRDLWKSLSAVAKGRSIVLTTHHLEEVEALADRVGIMVGGKMMCLGTLQHLKSKYVGGVMELQVSFAPPRGCTTGAARSSLFTGGGATESQNNSFVRQRTSSLSAASPTQATSEEAHAEATCAALRAALPPSVVVHLIEVSGSKITIGIENAPLSALFTAVENHKCALERAYLEEERASSSSSTEARLAAGTVRRVTEYALSQCTLEQVFLRIGLLARQEEDADNHANQSLPVVAVA